MIHPPAAEVPQAQGFVFLSYGRDPQRPHEVALARRLFADLRGHDYWVWLDERLRPGDDWADQITEGLRQAGRDLAKGRFVLLLTPHAVRPGGFCWNELAWAQQHGLPVIPVLVADCARPLPLYATQYLDLRDCLPVAERPERYQAALARLLQAIDKLDLNFDGGQARLLRLLDPLPFDAEFRRHLPRFTGRAWVAAALDDWLTRPSQRVFGVTGNPGTGKTALATWRCARRADVPTRTEPRGPARLWPAGKRRPSGASGQSPGSRSAWRTSLLQTAAPGPGTRDSPCTCCAWTVHGPRESGGGRARRASILPRVDPRTCAHPWPTEEDTR
jgi:hypothetical protein